MECYVFETNRGWSALELDGNTVQGAYLPSSPDQVKEMLEKTGQIARFVSLKDDSIPLINKFRAYYLGELIDDWGVELDLSSLPAFYRRVLEYVYTIPYAQTCTYGKVAQHLNSPGAFRAVGQALKHNPIPLIIPCHRVIAQNSLGGFSAPGGVDTKKEMLLWEKDNYP